MPIRLLSAPGPEKGVDVIPCLVYVDPRTQEGVVREEYIRRINLGLRDAGLPKEWVRKVVRRWIPKEEGDESESEEEEKCDEEEKGGVLEEVDDEVGWGGRKVIAKREDDGVLHWVPTGE
ncbi:hypothetical protein BDZ91DRAFT_767696 [Kalaharituber pfeilii]|nr:hypothetical protein BDZ91DRAFT_767696 [Kalaharituber pfeilii]